MNYYWTMLMIIYHNISRRHVSSIATRSIFIPNTSQVSYNRKAFLSRLYYSPKKIRDSLSEEEEYLKSSKRQSYIKPIQRFESRADDYKYEAEEDKYDKKRDRKKKDEAEDGHNNIFKRKDKPEKRKEQVEESSFRSRRVFVQGLPEDATWQDLKDHFKLAGEVAYASISNNGKGHGIVQYETVEEAKNAIDIMRNFPLDGSVLYVRADVQQRSSGKHEEKEQQWRCAHQTDNIPNHESVLKLIKSRNQARKTRDYDEADEIRKQLLTDYSVHVDDTLKLYWNDASKLEDIKGTGSWKANAPKTPWRQLKTTPQKDDLVHSNLIYALLRQRDEARKARLFDKADQLLDQITNAPNRDGVVCKINDEQRTWRVWSVDPPQQKNVRVGEEGDDVRTTCLRLVHKYQPEKLEEAYHLLEKFEGREEYILEKLKDRFGL